jgi:hypothetical protein
MFFNQIAIFTSIGMLTSNTIYYRYEKLLIRGVYKE